MQIEISRAVRSDRHDEKRVFRPQKHGVANLASKETNKMWTGFLPLDCSAIRNDARIRQNAFSAKIQPKLVKCVFADVHTSAGSGEFAAIT